MRKLAALVITLGCARSPPPPARAPAADQVAIAGGKTSDPCEGGQVTSANVEPQADDSTTGLHRIGTTGGGPQTGPVTPGGARVNDTHDREADVDRLIRQTVREHLSELQGCYERARAKNPALAAKLELKFTITANGDVVAASATGLGATIEACVISALKRMPFPKPEDGGPVRVIYPLDFAPS